MSNTASEVETRASRLLEIGYLGSSPPELQALCIAVYRLLLRGVPVSTGEIARATGMDRARVSALFGMIPDCAYDRDDRGGITAFIGLSLTPTSHMLILDEGTLYTWCVFDALFLPRLLARRAEIVSRCRAGGEEIRVEVAGDALLGVEPRQVVMSLVAPDQDSYRQDLRGSFCCEVNFFLNRRVFEDWRGERRDIEAISLADAFALAEKRNADRFPDIDMDAPGPLTNC